MTSSTPSPEIDLSWQMREREARLLAELMRTSRLTVLYGETGPGRTALLTDGVVPLLRRRESDVAGAPTRESRVVIPFPDRRSRLGGRVPARLAELVVFFDAWSEQPSTSLRNCILNAASTRTPADEASGSGLADMLEAIGKRQDLQFLIVLDRFEELIALDATVRERFIDEFCEAVNRVGLCANFLLSISEDAKPRLEGLRRRIQGFDDFSVRLLRWNSVVEQAPVLRDVAPTVGLNMTREQVVPVSKAAAQTPRMAESTVALPAADRLRSGAKAARARAKLARAIAGPHVPIETKAVYAFIELTLTETAKSSRSDLWQNLSHIDITTATTPPQAAKPNERGPAHFDDAGQSSAPPPGCQAQTRGASTFHTHQVAPEDADTITDAAASASAPAPAPAPAPVSASFAGVTLQSALNWLERRIRPKP